MAAALASRRLGGARSMSASMASSRLRRTRAHSASCASSKSAPASASGRRLSSARDQVMARFQSTHCASRSVSTGGVWGRPASPKRASRRMKAGPCTGARGEAFAIVLTGKNREFYTAMAVRAGCAGGCCGEEGCASGCRSIVNDSYLIHCETSAAAPAVSQLLFDQVGFRAFPLPPFFLPARCVVAGRRPVPVLVRCRGR